MIQRRLSFELPSGTGPLLDASDWREHFVAAQVCGYPELNTLRISCPPGHLGISPSTPGAGDWLLDRVEPFSAAVADRVGRAVPFQVIERPAAVDYQTESLCAYRFPRLVIAKGGGDWAGLQEERLAPEVSNRILRNAEAALRREWQAWGCLPPALAIDTSPFLVLADAGRAAIIPAVHANRSGNGKPVYALVRRHFTVLSPFRIVGDFFAGPLASLGFSRMAPAQAPDVITRDIQRALLALPPYLETASC